jgi:hypothetical protein
MVSFIKTNKYRDREKIRYKLNIGLEEIESNIIQKYIKQKTSKVRDDKVETCHDQSFSAGTNLTSHH